MKGKKVLVVEDNLLNLELVEFILEHAGAIARRAMSAKEAREEMAGEVPDLVLMDMNLPDEDGLDLVKELKGNPRYARVCFVALTAHAMRGDEARILSGGCDGYLAKPIDTKTFISSLVGFLAEGRVQ